MKRSLVLVLTISLVTEVIATDRGAAERALMWTGYMAEEVHTDSSKWTIAHTCVGTRTGIRGQSNRCTYLELLEHVYTQTPLRWSDPTLGYLDQHAPDRATTQWTIDPNNVEGLNPKQIADATYNVAGQGAAQMDPVKDSNGRPLVPKQLQQRVENGKPVFKTGKKLVPGYSGAFLIQNVMKGVAATEHYKGMGLIGDSIARAKVEIDKLTSGDEKTKLGTWYNHALNAADYVIDLREMDGNKVLLSNQGLGAVNNLHVISKPEPAATRNLHWVDQYPVPDMEAMGKDSRNVNSFGSEAAVQTAINNRMTAMTAADNGNHEAMNQEIRKTRNAIAAGGSCTP